MMTAIVGLLVPAEGPARIVTVDRDDVRALAGLIGAEYLEYVRTPLDRVAMLADEEGLLTGRPTSPVTGLLYAGRIVGDVLIAGEVETVDGLDVADLTSRQLTLVAKALGLDELEWERLRGAQRAVFATREWVAP